MKRLNNIKITLLFILFIFSINSFSQFSKTHYVPPLATQGFGASEPEDQYIYVSTPNENPISVTIFPIGGTPITNNNVSNSNPWPYYIGNGNNTDLIALTSDSDHKFDNKGFIIEAEDLVYVSVRLFSGSNYQAGSIVSKGLAGIGKEFRVGTFENAGSGFSNTYMNFISVLATEDNTTLNFSDFDQGVIFIDPAPPSDIILNSGESYIVGIRANSTPENATGLIGALVFTDKPVAVNAGSFNGANSNYNTDGGGQDIGIDQIAPVERIGTEYIFVRGIGPSEVERPLIVAHEDNTEVYVNGNLYTTIPFAGDYVSIESIEYGVDYLINDYTGFDNPNNDGQIGDDGVWGPYLQNCGWDCANDDGPESIDGIPIDPDANLDDEPGLSESSSMYVQTSKPVFAYQAFGGVRPGTLSRFGVTGGVANVGLFFVPPLNCQTPKIVKNIPSINAIGDELFNGVVTIVTETGSTVLINGQDISNYNATPQLVAANPLFETYTIEGLTGDISIESTNQVYVASFGAYTYASFGGYYSGFAYQPEIVLDEIAVDSEGCIPNLELKLNSIATFDEYQWYFNGVMIDGATGNSFTPTDPGYYQISGAVTDCDGILLSDNIPVSACPPDTDFDGVNDNIDIDIDNDGILNCEESLGDKNLDFSGTVNGDIEGLANFSWDDTTSSDSSPVWDGNSSGEFSSLAPPIYESVNAEGVPVELDGYNNRLLTFGSEVSLRIEQNEILTGSFDYNIDNQESFVYKVPPSKSITILNPDNQILIDTNFDGIYESGVTSFSNFEIRFKLNGTDLNTADATYKLYTHLTSSIEFTHFNSNSEFNGISFKMIATCFPKDSDNDGIVDSNDVDSDNDGILDIIENNGVLYQPLSNIDENQDGYDDIFNGTSPLDFDEDGVQDYLDLDSDNDGIYDLQEAISDALDTDLNGIIDGDSFGNNGLSNDLENSIDSGVTNYTLSNIDDDENYNYIDLDSDGDDCFDATEAGYTDGDSDGILGDSPVAFDESGLVTSGTDGYALSIDDYLINAPLSIVDQPVETLTACEDSTIQISVVLNTLDSAVELVDSYQWQSSVDGIDWFDITDNPIYSGSNNSILEINNTPFSFNNFSFRVIIQREGNGCEVISNPSLILIDPLPIITLVDPLEECDNDYDGIDIFDLSQKTEELLGGQLNISVSYHESQEDADNAFNPITEPYSNLNSADTQNIFVRLEDNETFCYATTTLALVVNPIPVEIELDIIEVCDDDYDGVGSFDLSLVQDFILNEQPNTTSVTFHETQEQADTAFGALPLDYENTTSPNTQELIVRLENADGCFSTTTQGLIVNPLSLIEVVDYELCDYNNPGSMIEEFDIISYIDDYFTTQNVTETYHGSLEDAESGDDPYSTAELTNYSNSDSASEEIFVRLVDNVTACVTTGSFNIVVNPLPNVIVNTDLVQCDIDDIQDGISIYNLEEAAENIVIPNGPGDSSDNYVLTFHLSQEELEAGEGAIDNPTSYVNLTPLQNIYCRVENIATGCYTTSFFYLETIFNPIPEDAGLIVCDNSEGNGNDYDGLGLFTLSNADNYVLSLIVANPNNDITSPDQLTIAYYASEEDALLELNQLPNQYTSEVPDSQVVYLRVERDNDCFGINSMLLQVLPVPVYNEVLDEILCTYTPGTFDVDLNDYNAQDTWRSKCRRSDYYLSRVSTQCRYWI